MIKFSDSQELQKKLFDHIKALIPDHHSLVAEIADFFNISNDSAYRRIRGDKQLNLQELFSLCKKFGLSLDTYLDVSMETIPFSHIKVDEDKFDTKAYLTMLLERCRSMNASNEVEMTMIANDLIVFQLLQFPELAAFKIFFWQKSNFGFDSLKRVKFSLDVVDKELLDLSSAIVHEYCQVPTVEIVGIDAVGSFIRQIKYYLDLGFFEDPKDAITLCNKILSLIEHFEKEADLGFKFPHGTSATGSPGNFTMYYNELFIIDGIVLIQTDEIYSSYIGTGPLNFIQTTNQDFYNQKYRWAKNLMSKSTLVSGVSEKDRQRYFNKMHEDVSKFKKEISAQILDA